MEKPQENQKQQPNNEREAGMMTNIGAQGVGKTYQNMHIIKDYVKDKLQTKVRGRKCLIFDTNGEYTQAQFERNNIPNFHVKTISVKDIEAWSRSETSECRRIDAKSLTIKEKKRIIEYVMEVFINGMFVLEDINTYILSLTHMEEIVGGLVNLRHRAVDVMISYQRLRAVEPIILANSRWIRMHYQVDNIDDVKGKLSNQELMKIAQLLINERYLNQGDKRFFVYVNLLAQSIEGKFNQQEFILACEKYLNINKKAIKDYSDMHDIDISDAKKGKINELVKLYYGNQS
jgi:hypothetical protein